jgi:hypothetical protein
MYAMRHARRIGVQASESFIGLRRPMPTSRLHRAGFFHEIMNTV